MAATTEMSISQVARQAGLHPSTLRYYEEIGLLPAARRRNGQRRYDSAILVRLAVIHTAQQAGFTLNEIAVLVNEILPSSSPSPQWRELLRRKMLEVNTLLSHVEQMRALLEEVMRCDDPKLADCIYETGQKHALLTAEPIALPFMGNLKY